MSQRAVCYHLSQVISRFMISPRTRPAALFKLKVLTGIWSKTRRPTGYKHSHLKECCNWIQIKWVPIRVKITVRVRCWTLKQPDHHASFYCEKLCRVHSRQSAYISTKFTSSRGRGRRLHKTGCCHSLTDEAGGQHRNMQTIFAKNGEETVEPVEAQVKGEFDCFKERHQSAGHLSELLTVR